MCMHKILFVLLQYVLLFLVSTRILPFISKRKVSSRSSTDACYNPVLYHEPQVVVLGSAFIWI